MIPLFFAILKFCSTKHLFNSLLSYQELQTNEKDKYTCEICGKVYLRPWSYYGHMREHAAGDKQHTCEVCNKQFQNVNNLKQHMLVHTGNYP